MLVRRIRTDDSAHSGVSLHEQSTFNRTAEISASGIDMRSVMMMMMMNDDHVMIAAITLSFAMIVIFIRSYCYTV